MDTKLNVGTLKTVDKTCYESLPSQLKYSPRNLDGFGLTDGEGVERLWSYLRRYSRMTKEMRPSHRVDVLSDAVKFYSRQSFKQLGKRVHR